MKYLLISIKILLSVCVISLCVYIGNRFEFWSQIGSFDNVIGVMPVILLIGATTFLIFLVWKRYKNAMTSTIVLIFLAISWSLLFIPALTGNWYPNAKIFESGVVEQDLSEYAPFINNTKVAVLEKKASIKINEELPTVDGATALYPIYSAFANAVYDKGSFVESDVVCTNTPNAYKRIISGDCDIIFVAQPSEKQMQAAKDAGVNLVMTPIGREAFVFLAGKTNPVEGLTYQQIKNIYTGKTAKWKTIGWEGGGNILVFQRPEGSGSQTGLQYIMGKLPIQVPQPLPDSSLIGTGSMMQQLSVEWSGVQPALGYSYRYYATTMYANSATKLLSVNGVYPTNETIANESYPFASNFYAVTNGEPTGNVKVLIDWILSAEGQCLVEKTGYAPVKDNK